MEVIPLFKIDTDASDIEAIRAVLSREMYWTMGPTVQKFEEEVANYVGTRYAVALNSGTSALHAVLAACGIHHGDEVIVPSFTFIATANAPLFVGATPVFADIDRETYGLDLESVEASITERTRAVVAVHYAGRACRIEGLREIADRHGLWLIEDAAEAMGATIRGRNVGTVGHAAVLSFCQNKIITTGEGGAVVTNDAELAGRVRLCASHGRQDDGDYFAGSSTSHYITLGYNYRLPDVLAALGSAQLSRIERLIELRRNVAALYNQALASLRPSVRTPGDPPDGRHVYQLYTVEIDGSKGLRDALMRYLRERGIGCKVYFDPVHMTEFHSARLRGTVLDLPNTLAVSGRVLSLPMYPSLRAHEIARIAEEIDCFFRGGNREYVC